MTNPFMTSPDIAPDSYDTWSGWINDNPHAPEQDKLDTLREFIWEEASGRVGTGEITEAWANKKLGPLGIVKRFSTENAYVLEVPVTVAPVSMTVYASNRAAAEMKFTDLLASRAPNAVGVTGVKAAGDPVFLSGPEDADPLAFDPNAPTTASETLVKLRETILLAVVAGPRICVDGANEVLDAFDLEHVPARKTFTVTRPAEAEFRTEVEAFDQASAERVAEWRWNDNRTGFATHAVADEGDFVVTEKS